VTEFGEVLGSKGEEEGQNSTAKVKLKKLTFISGTNSTFSKRLWLFSLFSFGRNPHFPTHSYLLEAWSDISYPSLVTVYF
jgi:hypothetical protein